MSKNKIIIALCIIILLISSFFLNASTGSRSISPTPTTTIPKETAVNEAIPSAPPPTQSITPTPIASPEEIPQMTATPEAFETVEKLVCTLSVKCDTILDNIEQLSHEKIELVPENGIIFAEKQVEFDDGESVFDVLLRQMQGNNIHLEFESTPVYNSIYIEGIANLYEFDCGELSGWMYSVNGEFPNYGCSRYILSSGDKIEWIYTCDSGADVKGNN